MSKKNYLQVKRIKAGKAFSKKEGVPLHIFCSNEDCLHFDLHPYNDVGSGKTVCVRQPNYSCCEMCSRRNDLTDNFRGSINGKEPNKE